MGYNVGLFKIKCLRTVTFLMTGVRDELVPNLVLVQLVSTVSKVTTPLSCRLLSFLHFTPRLCLAASSGSQH